MRELPLVSVIVPVYNTGDRLRSCIDSLICQKYSNLQIIIIDDGSTDGTESICDELSALDARIEVKHKANGGVSTARNLGLEISKGDFICFVDADDTLREDGIFELTKIIQNDCSDVVIAGKYINYYDKSIVELRLERVGVLRCPSEVGEHLQYLNEASSFDVLWNKLYRRQFLRSFDIRFQEFATTSQDLLFNVDLFMHDPVVSLVADAYYEYYKSFNESIVSRFHKNMLHIMNERNAYLRRLFDHYGLIADYNNKWLDAAYFKTVKNVVINAFRPGSEMTRKDRVSYITSVGENDTVRGVLANEFDCDLVEKVLLICLRARAYRTIDLVFNSLYLLRQFVKRIQFHS